MTRPPALPDRDGSTRRASARPGAGASGDLASARLPHVGIADWQRYLDEGGEIERTLISDCDACDAITEVHVPSDRYGGVLAFCVDPQACMTRQRADATARTP